MRKRKEDREKNTQQKWREILIRNKKRIVSLLSDDSSRLTLSPSAHYFVSVCVACTDTELHSLAARLKDWFGVLHLDANRDLKSSDSFDSTAGREYTRYHNMYTCGSVRVCVCVRSPFLLNMLFSPHEGRWGCRQRPPSVLCNVNTSEHISALPSYTHRRSHLTVLLEKDKM